MRRRVRAALLLVGTLSTSPIVLSAQFQEPTKEELQMKNDPKAPGADTVYLYYEDVQDAKTKTRSYYARIKVLTEKGIERATPGFSHDPATKFEVRGRTIHTDGTIVPLTDQPSDLEDFKSKRLHLNWLTFSLPSVEVGSILEYRVKFKYTASTYPTWIVQQDTFVRKAHYEYTAKSEQGINYRAQLNGMPVGNDGKGKYWLDVSDIPALPREDWMPPLNLLMLRVSFFYTEFTSRKEYWNTAEEVWAKFVLHFTNPTNTLKTAVSGMVTANDSETVKLQKIYAAVMKLENTDFTRKKTKVERKKEGIKEIHNAQDVWRNQSGSRDEIALLYVALCRAAGLNVVPMEVVDRSRELLDEAWWSMEQLNDYIAVAQVDGKQIYLDPGERMCNFGLLHWKHTMTRGFMLLPDNTAAIGHTPSPDFHASRLTRVADLRVDPTGRVVGTVRLILQGQEALYWRQLSLENDENEVRKEFNEWVEGSLPDGVHGEFDRFLGLTDCESNLLAAVQVSGNLGTVTGKHFFLPELPFESKAQHPFVMQNKRTIPIDLHYARVEEDDVTYHLPIGYAMDLIPKPLVISWPERAKLTISVIPGVDTVQVVRDLVSGLTILDPKEYGTLHDFYQKVAAADQQQITLAMSPNQ